MDIQLALMLAFFTVALLYAIVGHAGGSGYIAVMVVAGMAMSEIRPTALALNVLVSLIATIEFARAGHFRSRLLLPFVIGSLPMAYLGGSLQLPQAPFKVMLGLALIFSAWRLFSKRAVVVEIQAVRVLPAVAIGAIIGLFSGLLGIGGGIFLTPILLMLCWATPKQAAAVSAPFILVNSISALAGIGPQFTSVLPAHFPEYAAVVAIGGLLGAHMGGHRLPGKAILTILSAVLLLAGGKMLYI
jgi:uncharacterized membrane protein YfcA